MKLPLLPLVRRVEREIQGRLAKATLRLNEYGYDPYGFHPETARRLLLGSALLYRYYFRVETHHIDRVPEGRMLLVANHAGQFAYDGAMLTMAMLLEAEPPRLTRGMAEYLFWKVPYAGILASRIGTLVGTPDNCVEMLRAGECVVVFPEGARGANKPFRKRYQLQRFGLGFMRLALESDTPIVPVGIVGSEEQQPGIANLEGVGRALGLPSFPITVTSPWIFPWGVAVAFPVKYRIWFGEPMHFDGRADDEDAVIQQKVDAVKAAMDALLTHGRKERSGIFT